MMQVHYPPRTMRHKAIASVGYALVVVHHLPYFIKHMMFLICIAIYLTMVNHDVSIQPLWQYSSAPSVYWG